jgi:hypothetical protein
MRPLRTGLGALMMSGVMAGAAAVPSALAAAPWSAPERLYPFDGPQAVSAQVASFGDFEIDGSGRTAVAYYRAGMQVRTGTVRDGFGPPTNLGRYVTAALAIAPDGRVTVAMQRHLGAQRISDIVVRERSPAGVWSAPESISEPGPFIFAERPDIGVDAAGDVTVVWQQQGPTYDYQAFAAYRPAGGQFGSPTPLSGLASPAQGNYRVFFPRIAAGADGQEVVVWSRTSPTTPASVEAAVGRNGVWQPLRTISAAGQLTSDPSVAIGPHGEAVVAWHAASGSGVGRVQAAVRAGCGDFGPPADLSEAGELHGPVRLGVDRLGNVLAAWARDQAGTSRVEAARLSGGASGWEPARELLAWTTPGGWAPAPPALGLSPEGDALVAAVEPAGTGSLVHARTGSVRSGRFGAAEEVIRGPKRSGDALAGVALGIPVVASELVRDPLDVSSRRGAPVRLSAGQLLINQRIAQAALRQANAIEGLLDAGLGPQFIRNSSLDASAFGPGVQLAQDVAPACIPPSAPAQVPTTPASAGSGRVRLSVAQLLTNQRIAQAALRRANALQARIDAGLTGGDVRDGSIDPTKLAPGLRLVGLAPGAAPAAPTVTRPAPPARTGGRVTVSADQLLIGQRIAQAALRRTSALVDRLAAGLTTSDFQPGSLGAADLVHPS